MVAARVDGELRDLAYALRDGDDVEPVRASTPPTAARSCGTPPRTCWRRPCRSCYPDAKLGIGPPIENGFYYDFDVEEPFTPDDLAAIEKRMQQIVKAGQRFSAAWWPTTRRAPSWPTSRTSSS